MSQGSAKSITINNQLITEDPNLYLLVRDRVKRTSTKPDKHQEFDLPVVNYIHCMHFHIN